MSLEQELARNTEALIALTAALSAPQARALPVVVESKLTQTEFEALKVVADPKPVHTPDVVATRGVAAEAATAPPSSVTSPTIEYAQVAKAITDTFKVDRAKTIAALVKFGATKGPQLKAEDYAAFLAVLAE